MDEGDIEALLEQARNYRRLGNAMYDRHTRLALLELAFEYEERARIARDSLGQGAEVSPASDPAVPPVQDLNRADEGPKTDRCAG